MSGTNGTLPRLTDLKEQIKLERARTSLARAKQERALCEGLADGSLGPGYGDLLNPFGYRLDPFGGLWLPMQQGGVSAKRDGRNAPFFQSDADLDRMRGLAQWLTTKNDIAIGILDNLCNFTVKKGYDWDTRPTEGNEENRRAIELAAQVKRVVKHHDQFNNARQRERSAFTRAVRDGDTTVRHYRQDDGSTVMRFVRAEQLRDPGDAGPHASFGIETDPDDVETPLRYWVTYDGTDYEGVPADDVSFLKRNADEEVKRGVSDFYSTGDTLDDVHKLLRNMRKGGGVLAAMAWIEEFESATAAQLSAHQGGLKDLNRPQIQHPLTGRNVDYQQMEPGTVVRVQKGKKYLPPPLAGNTVNFTGIVQACLRSVGVRWNFPEYMTSGDASNANMASLFVSGSPTVNTIECQQDKFGALYLRWRWIAVKNACDAGLIRADFAEVQALVDLHYTPPLVAISNEGEQATIDAQDIAAGVMSLQTRRARRKLDNEQEKKNLAEEPPTRVSGKATDLDAQGNPVRQDSRGDPTRRAVGDRSVPDQSAGDSVASASVGGLQAILALQTAVYKGEIPREAAIANAEVVFKFGPQEAARLFPEVPPEKTADDGQGGQGGGPIPFGESRQKGEVWQGESGRWFTINDAGHVAPASAPGGGAAAPAGRSFNDRQSAKDWVQGAFGDAVAGYSLQEKYATGKYAGGAYKKINAVLRGKEKPANEQEKFQQDNVVKGMDSVLAKTTTPEPVTTWRGVGAGVFPADLASLVGTALPADKGYSSTSLNRATAEPYATNGGVLMEVRIPAGTNVAPVTLAAGTAAEQELLLGRGTSFRVIAAEGNRLVVEPVTPKLGESFTPAASHLREALWIESNLTEAREKGVPFQGPSGRWFVVNDKGRTVPAKNPGAQDKAAAKGQGAAKKGAGLPPGAKKISEYDGLVTAEIKGRGGEPERATVFDPARVKEVGAKIADSVGPWVAASLPLFDLGGLTTRDLAKNIQDKHEEATGERLSYGDAVHGVQALADAGLVELHVRNESRDVSDAEQAKTIWKDGGARDFPAAPRRAHDARRAKGGTHAESGWADEGLAKLKAGGAGAAKERPKADKQPKRTPAEKVAAAKQAVEEHRKTGDHAALTAHLATLSVAEIGALKKDLGIKASGAKAELAKKVAERAIAGAAQKAKAEPKEEPAGKAKKEPAPSPAAAPEVHHKVAAAVADVMRADGISPHDEAPVAVKDVRAAAAKAGVSREDFEREIFRKVDAGEAYLSRANNPGLLSPEERSHLLQNPDKPDEYFVDVTFRG